MWRKPIFSNMDPGESATIFQMKVFNTGPSKDFDQIFSYLLQFLKTLRTYLFYQTFFMAAFEIGTKTHENR